MASSKEFVAYAAEQLRMAGEITAKRMFGEYGLYCDGKFFGGVADDQLFIKITKAGEAFFPDCERGFMYEGAKESFLVTEMDDIDFLGEFVRRTCEELPMPKPKKPKAAKTAK